MANKKSDVAAKLAYVNKLNAEGYKARITGSPADVTAEKEGETWYFEIKMTHQEDRYFGAATQTEWAQAFKDPAHFRFVVAIADEADEHFRFIEYTPAEFMEFSTIPPFKVYFNIDFTGKPKRKSKREKKSVSLTEENFHRLNEAYNDLK
jgi:hypothetical protein